MKFKKILIPLIIVVMVFMMALPSLAEPVTYPDGGVYCDNLYDFFTFSGPAGFYDFSGEYYYSDDLSVITKRDNGVSFGDSNYLNDIFAFGFGDDLPYPNIEFDFSVTFYVVDDLGEYVSGMLSGYITIEDENGQTHEPNFYIYPTVVDGIPYYTIDIHEEYSSEGLGIWLSDCYFSMGPLNGVAVELNFVQVGDMEFYFGPIRPDEPTVFENVISNTTGFVAGAVSWVKLFAQTIVAYPLLFVFVIAVPLVGLGIGLVTRVKR